MCRLLSISRGVLYYRKKNKKINTELENSVIEEFRKNKSNYGGKRIKKNLEKKNFIVSVRKVREIMKKYNLISNYGVKKYKPSKGTSNEEVIPNIVEQKFNGRRELEVVVSDLTYIKVGENWNYICILIDLYNREIIGYSAGESKDAHLVKEAFSRVIYPLKNIEIFHTDRGMEFKNRIIEDILNKFSIKRSLSKKGNPYDNAVAEATYKTFKTEFVKSKVFRTLEELRINLFEYVNWYNNVRLHSSLEYLSPIQYRRLKPANSKG